MLKKNLALFFLLIASLPCGGFSLSRKSLPASERKSPLQLALALFKSPEIQELYKKFEEHERNDERWDVSSDPEACEILRIFLKKHTSLTDELSRIVYNHDLDIRNTNNLPFELSSEQLEWNKILTDKPALIIAFYQELLCATLNIKTSNIKK